jgi:hypothetical protein
VVADSAAASFNPALMCGRRSGALFAEHFIADGYVSINEGLILLASATAATLLATTAVAETDDRASANYYLPACRNFINEAFAIDPYMQGKCIGILQGMDLWAEYAPFEIGRFCVPPGVTPRQVVTVVVKWLEQRPERWNEDFMSLASFALHDAWPCPLKR